MARRKVERLPLEIRKYDATDYNVVHESKKRPDLEVYQDYFIYVDGAGYELVLA